MKLSHWAKKQGITYRTAWEYFRTGKLPSAYKLPGGAIIIPESIGKKQDFIVTYARVSSSQNKDNLESQSKRLIGFCNAKGWTADLNLKEIGSGLNDKRKKLESVLLNGKATKIVVEHKDRLSRFGVRYLEILCSHINCEIIILNQTETDKQDLIQDFVSIITSFCAKIYGQRRSKRKTEQLIKELQDDKKIDNKP
ncbi:MAG: IS607 family transposase [bacterium]|nr:IS607 family transposase [bacterium]